MRRLSIEIRSLLVVVRAFFLDSADSASAQVPTCRVAVCVCFEHGALDAQGEESAATVVEAVAGALLR